MSQTVTIREYFNALIQLVRKHHMIGYQLDEQQAWKNFETISDDAPDRLEKIKKATTKTLQTLNRHSLYWDPFTHHEDGKPYIPPFPKGRIEDGDIAYLWLPECLDLKDHHQYAQTGFDISTRLMSQNLAGAIVDLRDDGGGGCDPMMAAASPFLDKENFVGWANGHNEVTSHLTWDHDIGLGRVGDYMRRSIPPSPGTPNTHLPVAVIYGHGTCSAGEMVALAFRGSPLSKSFGEATWGNTTGNSAYSVPYGDILGTGEGVIVLSLSSSADRHHNVFNDAKIQPDVPCGNPMERAIEWIRAFPR